MKKQNKKYQNAKSIGEKLKTKELSESQKFVIFLSMPMTANLGKEGSTKKDIHLLF